MEFISKFTSPLFMQSTSTVLVSGYNSPQFRKLHCEGDKDVFLNMNSVWKLFYYSPKEAESMKGIQVVLCFPKPKT